MSPHGDKRSRRHHYLPAFHLRYFADPSGAVWVHDRAGELVPNPKPLFPDAIAKEDELYTVQPSEDRDKSDQIERWLRDKVDAPASRAFAALTRKEPPSPDEKMVLARYIASRDIRTPRFRDFILSLAQSGIEAHQESLARDLTAFRELLRKSHGDEFDNFSDEEISDGIRSYKHEVRKEFWLKFLVENVEPITTRLAAEGWRAVHTRGCHFVTSDLGILKHRGDFSRAAPHMPGWWNHAAGWLIPLTPSLALMIAPGLMPNDLVALPEFADRVNRDFVTQADRFVFSDRAEPWILELWDAGG